MQLSYVTVMVVRYVPTIFLMCHCCFD